MRQDASTDRSGTNRDLAESNPAIEAALASRAFWKDLCEAAADLMFETDRSGRFTFVTPSDALGFQFDMLIGHQASDILCEWRDSGRRTVNPFTGPAPVRMQHVWLRRRDGSPALFAISARPTQSGGMRGIGIDVTAEDAETLDSIKAVLSESMLNRIVERMRDEVLTARILRAGLTELSDCIGAEGATVVATAADGIKPLSIVGTGWDELSIGIGPTLANDSDARNGVSLPLAGRHVLIYSNDTRFGPPSVLIVWRSRSEWRDDERHLASSVASAMRAVIEQDSIQREITDHSRTDVLTGLLTRRAFLAEARRRFSRLDRNREPATLMSIDVDNFGHLNEMHGMERGDEGLCQVAAILRDTFRPTDLVCRSTGDDFAVWLDSADIFAAAERAEWLCRNGASVLIGDKIHRLGFSVGLALRPANSLEDLDSLFRRADAAMRHAKRGGKGIWRASQQEIET